MSERRLYIFDLGDVILLGNRSLKSMAKELGLDELTFLEDYRNYETPLMTGFVSTSNYYKHLESNFGVQIKTEFFLDNYYPLINKPVLNMIRKLNQEGHKCVIGSNTFECYKTWMEKYTPYLFSVFFSINLSNEINRSKPSPRFFTYIMEKENFDAKNVYFIDDREENVDTASALNINAFRYSKDDAELKSFLFS